MAFTANELANIANAALDFYFNKGKTFSQTIQNKPFLDLMERKAKTFPGGKGDIVVNVKGAYGDGTANSSNKGFTHDDSVVFYNPANLKRAAFPWREHHLGLSLTVTELKIDGLSVRDTDGGGMGTSAHSQRDQHVLVNLLEDKLEDLGEQYARSMNTLLWGDGTADAKALAGIRALVTANPFVGVVGGIDRAVAANSWWRNRARTAAAKAAGGLDAVTSSAANGGALIQVLQEEKRQLSRFGGRPESFFAGSDFIAAMEKELRSNGHYTLNGFRGKQDGAMGDLSFDGVTINYDPTLDDLGFAKRGYWFDSRHIFLMKMDGEWRRQHSPSRPPDKFVLYRSITSTGQMIAQQLNSALVIDIA